MEAASRTGTSIHFENEVPRIGSVNKMAQCQCILKDGIPQQPQLDFSRFHHWISILFCLFENCLFEKLTGLETNADATKQTAMVFLTPMQ